MKRHNHQWQFVEVLVRSKIKKYIWRAEFICPCGATKRVACDNTGANQ